MAKKNTKPPTKTARNARLPAEKRIADIIAAARQTLSEKDYETALMSEIAEKAGVVEGTIYRYFENKRDLFIKVAEGWFEEILTHNTSNTSIDGTLNKLRHMLWWVLSIIQKEPVLTRFVLMELRPHPDYRSTRVYQLNKKFTENVISVYREAMEQGEFDESYDIPFIRDLVFGCIEHQTSAYLRKQGSFSVTELAEKIATITYKGLVKTIPDREINLDLAIDRLEAIANRLDKK
ncbi:MAG: TetR/AcrR family transcriptional regulator [Porticoccaceae bacterium]|nr:TetR/AcrR family transcriptional regulator [Porticoccaceae bacterium]